MPINSNDTNLKGMHYDINRGRTSLAVTVLFLVSFFFIFLLMPQLPDYETYRLIYDSGGGHLAAFGRDLGFVLLIQLAINFFSYEEFRVTTLFFEALLVIISINRLGSFNSTRIRNTIVFAFIPIILLKFGSQIREGLALVLWIYVLFCAKIKPNPILLIVITLLSISIHIGAAPLWGLLFIAFYLQKFQRFSVILASGFYATFIYAVSDVSRLEVDAFSDLSSEVITPDIFQIIYWSIFPLIMLHALISGILRSSTNKNNIFPIIAFRFVLISSMLGLNIGIFLQILINGFVFLQKGIFADLLRIESLILTLLSIYLVLFNKTRYGILLSVFLILDTVRTILAA